MFGGKTMKVKLYINDTTISFVDEISQGIRKYSAKEVDCHCIMKLFQFMRYG